jgi:hypothetical protein
MVSEALTEALGEVALQATAAKREAEEAHRREDLSEVLRHIAVAQADLEDAQLEAIRAFRSWGASWTDVAHVFDITRQAAWERFAHRLDDEPDPPPPAPEPPARTEPWTGWKMVNGGGS